MTHLISTWQKPASIEALQTTRAFTNPTTNQQVLLDIHPNHNDPNTIKALLTQYKLPHEPMFLQQVHGNQVIEYLKSPKSQFNVQADACFTRTAGVICAVMTADCLPVLITDSAGSFVAAVHCGWRSLYANILSKTMQMIKPKNPVLAWFGPCIQPNQYEVDESFVTHYLSRHPDATAAFTAIINHKSQANLYEMATLQLQQLGISQVSQSKECTYLNQQYYSWRETASPKRMATMAWIKTNEH